ncbi:MULTISPECIES: ABC transporter permease [Rhodobacterales]|jgi:putative spermidine/putrescine transport system permease protein|uniref:ABC transporter permease n=1 Tax=Rhodobacterales TaxID=204455 RepID=UPI00237F535B|nr:ABC transporter permease [Phaeobacter gallaeciensis]MDE4098127.1 ABC transporter permease [Phaeobacter gallaeciensis]MDE4106937.1 ABC transporter permease [Phaeobacter gallaeciensis]MDE4111604.1 ABC transporter permease [Phaeobacter gallaeciensis]MDE4115862.1 ABC transporter permease [Phaeobacter gallaeciensis]MDE4120546.1 ABC transporter permease [Phaeobacter gallaeciensis]
MSDTTQSGPVLAADGTPLKRSLARALRMQKMRALMLIAPLLLFILLTFILPIGDMLFRSVENRIVSDTLPKTVVTLADWDAKSGEAPGDAVYEELYYDLFVAAEAKEHTKLGTRLNYEQTGISSLFRSSGRKVDDIGKDHVKAIERAADRALKDEALWFEIMTGGSGAAGNSDLLTAQREKMRNLTDEVFPADIGFVPGAEISELFPRMATAYTDFALFTAIIDQDVVAEEDPWESVFVAFATEVQAPGGAEKLASYSGPGAAELQAAGAALADLEPISFKAAFLDIDEDWGDVDNWRTIQTYSPKYTSGYFLNSIDMQKGPDGAEARPENQQIYITLLKRTMFMSLVITGSCILLGYPVAWILANLPTRSANLLMILVLLPFWTSLLVRTSAWKVMLQQQGVINDVLVWLGLVADDARLVMINNQFGTIVAMTHILLPFMILPMYSVMQTINPSYLRAAKSLGATNWTAFWRVYFPQSVPGIGAGSILVFILAIGYYITPEIVGGTKGVFISNRIAYHISSSLNWGLAAALGAILLVVVLVLYWAYDKIVGIDNVKLG